VRFISCRSTTERFLWLTMLVDLLAILLSQGVDHAGRMKCRPRRWMALYV
jgi:hypothetical protein